MRPLGPDSSRSEPGRSESGNFERELEPPEPGSGAPRPSHRRRRSRPLTSGAGAILLVDLLALLIVLASAPAAWLWLDSSHPSPVPAVGRATPASSVPPVSSAGPSGGPGNSPGSSGAAASPSQKLVYGDGTWVRVDSLSQGEWNPGSAVLHDGRVVLVGGATGASSTSASDLVTFFDPATGHWTIGTKMLQPRAYPMVVSLSDGSVVVAGGSRNAQPLDTAERYFPEVGTWVAAGRLNLPRTQGTLTVLSDGRVLAVGGGFEGSPGWRSTASAELFDPTTGLWSLAAPMSVARAFHTATLLPDGEVLVAGGASIYNGTRGTVAASAEIYNPRSNTWRPAARMSVARYAGAATLLPDGRVLVAGGWAFTSATDPSLASAEIYDPASNSWTSTGSMSVGRGSPSMLALADGRVLAMAGVDPTYHVLATTEIYDSRLGTWQRTGDLPVAMERPAAQTLPDGRVLVAGGATDANAGRVTAVSAVYSARSPQQP
jgi:hypothetical protein